MDYDGGFDWMTTQPDPQRIEAPIGGVAQPAEDESDYDDGYDWMTMPTVEWVLISPAWWTLVLISLALWKLVQTLVLISPALWTLVRTRVPISQAWTLVRVLALF